MVRILRDKALATKFQILTEIAANQPDIQQKDIASRLSITPQAISQYIEKLVEEDLIVSDGRSKYRVTREGVNWILGTLRDLRSYSARVQKVITNVTICPAVADSDLYQDQPVGLEMKGGVLFATAGIGEGAKGIAVTKAKNGEDVGISNIEGIVDLQLGKITILKVPSIQRSGSKGVDLTKLREEIGKGVLLGAIGIEALIALKRIGVAPQYFYGVKEAMIEAAKSGLPFMIVCVEDDIPILLQRVAENTFNYELLDLEK
jgi:putative transcriptional regulator